MWWIASVGLMVATPAMAREPTHEDVLAPVLSREAEILEMLQTHDPEQHARLVRLKRVDASAYMQTLVRVAKVIERARNDPEARERLLDIQQKTMEIRALAVGFQELDNAGQRERRLALEGLATELLELKQADRRARLVELQARLDELQAEIDQREAQQKRVVGEYVDQLLQERVDL